MMHGKRIFSISKVDNLETLAEMLANGQWCLCAGFECGEYLFLNDATSEDGAQEYAIIKDGYQIESITVSWVESTGKFFI